MDTSLLIMEYTVFPTVRMADFEVHSECPTILPCLAQSMVRYRPTVLSSPTQRLSRAIKYCSATYLERVTNPEARIRITSAVRSTSQHVSAASGLVTLIIGRFRSNLVASAQLRLSFDILTRLLTGRICEIQVQLPDSYIYLVYVYS